MLDARRTTRPTPHGFTLIELLSAIAIIALLVGITFPVISAMQSGSRAEAGLNTIAMSSDVARQWVEPSAWDRDNTDNVQNESYSGTAAIYCPTGEVRIVVNFRNARRRANVYLEDLSPPKNGYRDITGVDYIRIPSGVGVAGILRTGPGANGVVFIAPPFAIAYNEFGHMNFGDENGLIYYNGDRRNDAWYDFNTRPNNYNPQAWDGGEGSSNADVLGSDNPVRALPFEAIECVPGVIIYDADDFASAGFSFAGGGSILDTSATDDAYDWLRNNGETLFFSPSTGVALRDEQE